MAEEISRERRLAILESLGSTVCESCKGQKMSRRSHCGACYRRLPVRMRKALYRQFGHGYEEAFEESLSYLAGLKEVA